MMKKLTGLVAAVALMGSGMALANEGKQHEKQQTQTQSSSGQDTSFGGSGTGSQADQSGMQGQLGGNQITGRVVKSDRKTIWVDHMGAIVPLKVDKNTQFADPDMKKASDFKEGDQVRASFEVRGKTDNIATNIQKDTGAGMGGSGKDMMKPDEGINQPEPLPPSNVPPPQEGTGGSGDLDSDIKSPDLGTDSDVPQGDKSDKGF